MDEKQFEQDLKDLINDNLLGLNSGVRIDGTWTFAEEQVTDTQHGLVVYLADGSEFHLVVVKYL